MTDNIRLMTEHEINKLKDISNVPIYGTYHKVFESEIALGSGNKNARITVKTLKHESIHECLTDLFNWSISMEFDRLYYSKPLLRRML
jgi:hypothetical protein